MLFVVGNTTLNSGDTAVYNRLAKAGSSSLQWLFASVTTLLAERIAPWMATDLAPFASEVVAIDATTLDPLARRLTDPADVSAGKTVLPGKLLALFDLRRQQWRRLLHLSLIHISEPTRPY